MHFQKKFDDVSAFSAVADAGAGAANVCHLNQLLNRRVWLEWKL